MSNARARRVAVQDPRAAGSDYADAFEIRLAGTDDRTAEEWLRDALEQLPAPVRWAIVVVHRYVLRFRLGPLGAPDHVLGWRVATDEPTEMVLQTSSSLLDATIVGRRPDPTRTSITTALRHRRPLLARLVWMLVGPLHRRIAPLLLERAAGVRSPAAAGRTVGPGVAG